MSFIITKKDKDGRGHTVFSEALNTGLLCFIAVIIFGFLAAVILPHLCSYTNNANLEICLAINKEGLAKSDISKIINQTKEIIKNRLELCNFKKFRINQYEDDKISIIVNTNYIDLKQIGEQQERIRNIVSSQGKLEFKLEAGSKTVADFMDKFPKSPPGYVWYEKEESKDSDEQGFRILVSEKAELTGEHIVKAGSHRVQLEGFVVDFKLDPYGTRIFADVTKKYASKTDPGEGRRLAIILDNKLVSAPVIYTPIPKGEGIIIGRFTQQQAQELAIILQTGMLPVKPEIIKEDFKFKDNRKK